MKWSSFLGRGSHAEAAASRVPLGGRPSERAAKWLRVERQLAVTSSNLHYLALSAVRIVCCSSSRMQSRSLAI